MDDAAAILGAVSAAVSAGGLLTAGTGPLRANEELVRSLDVEIWKHVERDATVETLRVVEASETGAVVDLAASVRYEGRTTGGISVKGLRRLSGPVVVIREDGEWKVADLLVDDRSLRDSIFTSAQTASIEGLTVSVLGGQTLPGQVRLYLEAQNGTGGSVSITRQAFGWTEASGRWRWGSASLAASVIPPGTTRLEAYGFGASVLDDRARRLILETSVGVVDVRPPSAAPQRRLPLALRLPLLRWLATVTGFTIAAWLLFGVGVASFFPLLFSGFLLFQYARAALQHRTGPPRDAWLVSVFAVLAAGTALFFAADGREELHRFVDSFDSWWGLGSLCLIWAAAYSLVAAAGLLRRRRRPTKRQLIMVGSFAVPGALLFALTGAFAPFHRSPFEEQRAEVALFASRGNGSAGKPAAVLSASHVLTRRYVLPHARSDLECVLDAWDVTTTRGSSWIIVTNAAAVANTRRATNSMVDNPKKQSPDLAKLVTTTIAIDRRIAGIGGVPPGYLC